MENPIAIISIKNKKPIIVELLPEIAPNTVNSFISLAQSGCYNNHAIERIVPGSWIDVSYTAFQNENAKYFIENEALQQKDIEIKAGVICMGGYGENKIAGGEFFFPLRNCPDLTLKYPVFGKICSGMETLYEIEKVETLPAKIESLPTVEINVPINPLVIQLVKIETYGVNYPLPNKKIPKEMPEMWQKNRLQEGYLKI